MVGFTGIRNVFLYPFSVDMRKGGKSLSSICCELTDDGQRKDSAFIFFGRNRKAVKIVVFDDNGIWMFSRMLDSGHFQLPEFSGSGLVIDRRQLQEIINSCIKTKARKVR